jgi:CrcB protein
MAWWDTTPGRMVLLALGGGTGTVLRFLVNLWVRKHWEDAVFPWHTFGINITGSILLGWLAVVCKDKPLWYLLLGTGVCGGFTTFSTFSVEAIQLLEKGRPGLAVVYVLGSVLAGLAGAYVAMALAVPRGEVAP